jgi:hypothetical protein
MGHPEGYIEAFANLYQDLADVISAKKLGNAVDPLACDFPNIQDGVRGMAFVETSIRSSNSNSVWKVMPPN